MFLDKFCRPDDKTARVRVASALVVIFPELRIDWEFSYARAAVQPWAGPILALAESATVAGQLSRHQSTDEEPLLATMALVAETQLLPFVGGFAVRRRLAGLLIEFLAFDDSRFSDKEVLSFATALRGELQDLRRDPLSRAALPATLDVLGLIGWLDCQPVSSTRLPDYFWRAWKKLSGYARFAINSPASTPNALEESTEPETTRTITAGDGDSEGDTWRGSFAPDDVKGFRRTPGTVTTIVRSTLSTLTPISAFTSASTSVVSDQQLQRFAAALVADADAAECANDVPRMEIALAQMIMVATGTMASHLGRLIWGKSGQDAWYPGIVTMDGEWLARPQVQDRHTKNGEEQAGPCVVHIPLPRAITDRLRRLNPAPREGDEVFRALPSAFFSSESSDGTGELLSPTALRRALPWRLARSEPLGLSAAQWIAGDDFGISTTPLYYDRYSADRLAQVVERITFPWFGESPSRTRKTRPVWHLGSQVTPSRKSVREFFSGLRAKKQLDLPARLGARMRNSVHGFVAVVGHRPNRAIGALTIDQFAFPDPIAIIRDKRVAPDWRERPVVLPQVWLDDFGDLIRDLQRAKIELADTALGRAAEKALGGSGSIFLDIRSVDDVRPFGKEAYIDGLPSELVAHDNFARHGLNHALIGRVPETLRVGQMGWHGDREGAWSEVSPWSPQAAAKDLDRPLSEHLKEMGWRRYEADASQLPPLPVRFIDWIGELKRHEKDFRAHLHRLERKRAQKNSEIAKELMPELVKLLHAALPELTISDRGDIQKRIAPSGTKPTETEQPADKGPEPANTSNENKPVKVKLDALNWIEFSLSGGKTKTRKAAVARNLLSILVRRARDAGVLEGPIPRRIIWQSPYTPGAFSRMQPAAFRTWRFVDEWLSAQSGLSESAAVAIGLILHGAYLQLETVLACMHPETTLSRVPGELDVVLAEPPGNIDEVDAESDAEAAELALDAPPQCFAFNGLAALYLQRWHNSPEKKLPSEVDLDTFIHTALPPEVRPPDVRGTTRYLIALTRHARVLMVDGIARLVCTGEVSPTTVTAARVAAYRGNLGVCSTTFDPNIDAASADRERREAHAGLSMTEFSRTLRDVGAARNSGAISEDQGREQLCGSLATRLHELSEEPSAVDLLARFVVGLLDRGGRRKAKLRLRTILGYVQSIAKPLVRCLGDSPLSNSDEVWQEAFRQIVGETGSSYRARRFHALRRFHWILSQEFSMPEIDFGEIARIAGRWSYAADAGLLSNADRLAIGAMLARDIARLQSDSVVPAAIHYRLASQLAFHTMGSSALRSGEIHGLRACDVDLAAPTDAALVRGSRYQSLKSVAARRRAELSGSQATVAHTLLKDWIEQATARGGGTLGCSAPLFMSLTDPNERIPRAVVFKPISDLVKWVCSDRHGRPYWLRKTGAHEKLSNVMAMDPPSLWPARDLVASMGQSSIRVTLGSYIHDPVLPLTRFFRSPATLDIGVRRIANAKDRSLTRVVRRRGGSRLNREDPSSVSGRVAQMLDRTPVCSEAGGFVELPELIGAEGRWTIEPSDIDACLRRVAANDPVTAACAALRINLQLQESLASALEKLRTEFKVTVSNIESAGDLNLTPPRRIQKDGGISTLLANAGARNVLATMCDSWLELAAMPGTPAGIPGTPSTWLGWERDLPALLTIQWSTVRRGAMEFRAPAPQDSARRSAWPLFRWIVLVAWIQRNVAGGHSPS